MRPASTKERILQEGLKLACTRGLCRVTFGTVARRANVSKSGIVAHFASMDHLQRAIIERAMQHWADACVTSSAESSSGLADLIRYLQHWIGWTKRAGLPGACPIALSIFEYSTSGGLGSVHVAVAGAEQRWRRTLIEMIDGAIASSELPPDVDSSQMAWELFGVYLSHQVSCHFLRATDSDGMAQISVARLIDGARKRC